MPLSEETVCGILYNSVPYYFIKNLQGDVIAIVDKNAKTVARYSYDAWGVPTITQDSTDCGIASINPYRYRGYYYDDETALYYVYSRYIDPKVGRFISSDEADLLGIDGNTCGYNLFSYCANNPITRIDGTGKAFTLLTCIVVGAIIGAVAGAGYNAYKGYIGGKRGWELAGHVLAGGLIGAAVGAAAGAAVYGVVYAAKYIGVKLVKGSCGTLGKTQLSSWQQAENAVRKAVKSVSSPSKRTFLTPYGNRIADAFGKSKKVIAECKYGYQGKSSFILKEIKKDAWLLKNQKGIKSVEWHFYRSAQTGKGGPSGPLLKELVKQGFKIIYH